MSLAKGGWRLKGRGGEGARGGDEETERRGTRTGAERARRASRRMVGEERGKERVRGRGRDGREGESEGDGERGTEGGRSGGEREKRDGETCEGDTFPYTFIFFIYLLIPRIFLYTSIYLHIPSYTSK